MDPINKSINLPPPVAEQTPTSTSASEANIWPMEQAPKPAEQASSSAHATPHFPAQPAMPVASMSQQSAVSTTSNDVVLNVQDDGDLIEKEWVMKAKQIVDANREDPYKQSEELTVFRADYMQKRYNKSIKVSK